MRIVFALHVCDFFRVPFVLHKICSCYELSRVRVVLVTYCLEYAFSIIHRCEVVHITYNIYSFSSYSQKSCSYQYHPRSHVITQHIHWVIMLYLQRMTHSMQTSLCYWDTCIKSDTVQLHDRTCKGIHFLYIHITYIQASITSGIVCEIAC